MNTSTVAPRAIDRAAPSAPVLDLARRLHDTVAQRLAGIAYLLAAEPRLSRETADRCRSEVEAALAEMRDALSAVVAHPEGATAGPGVGAREEARALLDAFPDLKLRWDPEDHAMVGPEMLIESFLAEALRNAHKHARPSEVLVAVAEEQGVVVVSVTNDGVGRRRGPTGGTGVGRRLLEVEASQHGALVESAPAGPERWSARLILPAAD